MGQTWFSAAGVKNLVLVMAVGGTVAVILPNRPGGDFQISSLAVDSSYQPWCVDVYGTQFTQGLSAQVYDSNGLKWGNDLPTQFGTNSWMTFCLPADVPPSQCNVNQTCEIQVNLVNATGSTSNSVAVILPSFAGPSVSSLALDTSYQPWCVNAYGSNFSQGLHAKIFDTSGAQWGADIDTVFGSSNWISFCLSSDLPPSQCNLNQTCGVTVKLASSSGALTNSAPLVLAPFAGAMISRYDIGAELGSFCLDLYGSNFTDGLVAEVIDTTGAQWGSNIATQFGSPQWITFCLPATSPPSQCNVGQSCQIQVKLSRSQQTVSNTMEVQLPAVSLPPAVSPPPVGSGTVGGLNGTFLDLSAFNWQVYLVSTARGVSSSQVVTDYFNELGALGFDTLVVGATRVGDNSQCASVGEAYHWETGIEYLGQFFMEAAKHGIKIVVGLTNPAWCGSDWWFASNYIGSAQNLDCSSALTFGDSFARDVMDDTRWGARTIKNTFGQGYSINRAPDGSLAVSSSADATLAQAFSRSFGGWYLTPEPPIFAAWRSDTASNPSGATIAEFSKYATLVSAAKGCYPSDTTIMSPPLLDIVWEGTGLPLMTPEQAGAWAGFFKKSSGVDILAVQDSVGAGGWAELDMWNSRGTDWSVPGFSKVVTQKLSSYYQAISTAVGRGAVWADVETFSCCLGVFTPNAGTAYSPISVSRLVGQLQAASPYVAKKVSFIGQSQMTQVLSNGGLSNRLFDAYQAQFKNLGALVKPVNMAIDGRLSTLFDGISGDPLNSTDPQWVVVTQPLVIDLGKATGLRWIGANVLRNDWKQVLFPTTFKADCLDTGAPVNLFTVNLPMPQPNGEFFVSNTLPLQNMTCQKFALSFLDGSVPHTTYASEIEITIQK